MAADKRKLITNYFNFEEPEIPVLKKWAKYGALFIILGIGLLYLQEKEYIGNFTIISVVLILTGLFSLWILIKPFVGNSSMFSSKAADGDMDIWFSEDMHEIIKPAALNQLKINPSSLKDENIIIVPYPVYWNVPGLDPTSVQRKLGEDGSYTYSVWTVQILIVTENFISYYSCIYDWMNTNLLNERTNEYFFEDISSVSNDVIPLDFTYIDNEEVKVGDAKVFKLSNMSGEKLTIITDIPALNVPEGYSNNLDRLVQAVRMLLRNRRTGETIEENKETLSDDGSIEFEVENRTSKEEKAFFHQQLRELYKDYNQVDESE
jgi:hypothetical protein